uniref:Telomere length regulation protein TEL2 homolog n=1 Tax=Macrostomum lignano TaxID=282301 RepID=A0A1I8IC32_9PLAT
IFKAHADDCFVASSDEQKIAFGQQFELLNSLLKIFHNFTDASEDFCLALSRVECLYRDCASPLLAGWVSRHVSVSQCRLLVNSVLGFVGNQFFKNNSDIYYTLSALELVEPVMPYLSSPVLNIKVLALFLIAFALDESQAELYESATEVMQFLVDSLKEATKSDNRTCYVSLLDADYQTYHAIELAQCINRLALNEVNKKLLVGFGLLPVLKTMLDGEAEDEIAAALDILFTLSFRLVSWQGSSQDDRHHFS